MRGTILVVAPLLGSCSYGDGEECLPVPSVEDGTYVVRDGQGLTDGVVEIDGDLLTIRYVEDSGTVTVTYRIER